MASVRLVAVTWLVFLNLNSVAAVGVKRATKNTTVASGKILAFDGGVDVFAGSMSRETVTARSMLGFSAYVMLGVHLSSYLLGVYGDYSSVGQYTHPSKVGDTNLRGTGQYSGIYFGIMGDSYRLLLSYVLAGAYAMDNTNVAGQSDSYLAPQGGFARLRYLWRHNLWIDLYTGYLAFARRKAGTTETDISSDKLVDYRLGIGLALEIF